MCGINFIASILLAMLVFIGYNAVGAELALLSLVSAIMIVALITDYNHENLTIVECDKDKDCPNTQYCDGKKCRMQKKSGWFLRARPSMRSRIQLLQK